ncbi:uncharacterized protein MELLADRAFT_93195 [Melampsora larici-populina 98AG31]|uniref:AMP-dependent synthetase/ligase domain-containing protein n=1 Tax=Melampsora larici-populina (strain 98AG31 / pathotype 3-4-7) TaxID=747676 RepID=F4S455_MELLP|nr:uncharacterized protein MELLADRAFT_93195 [Melampsora larici-populina 98AG31]EGG00565.1 hypothetical protein MELLADRAFT_93195 [Melampsora larici-populina 98AG31]
MSSASNDFKNNLPLFNTPPIGSVDLNPINLIDFHIKHNSNYPFGILSNPNHNKNKHGFQNEMITWNEIGDAILKVNQDLIGIDGDGDQENVVGILASSDPLVYFTMLLAIMRSGCVPFAISPRNSVTAIVHLIKSTNCKTLYVQFNPNQDPTNLSPNERFHHDQLQEVLNSLPSSSSNLKLKQFPTAFQLFPRLLTHEPYIPNPNLSTDFSFLPTPTKPKPSYATLMILHSSGTTSFPKPIYLTQPSFQSWINASQSTKFIWKSQILASMVLPAFHAMGIHFGLITVLADGAISGFFGPEIDSHGEYLVKSPNSWNVLLAMKNLGCTVGAFSPMMLAEFSNDQSSVEFLKTLERVGFGGGPLTVEIGNKLVNEGVQLSAMYGSTEVGIIATLFPEHPFGDHWEYFEISNQLTYKLIPHDDLYELVILSSEFHRCSLDHVDKNLDHQVYHTNDLLSKHPFLELYRIVGRLDDQIILSNSEKTNPGPLEAILGFHPAIKGSLFFGRGKPQNGVIIEPEDGYLINPKNPQEVKNYIDLIWSSIEEVNRFAPSHSRLIKELILITDPRHQPLPKTNKGQVSRVKTLEMFSQQIEEIYHQLLNGSLEKSIGEDENGVVGFENLLEWVTEGVREVLGWEVEVDQDLFGQGCDSLSAIQIKLKLNPIFFLNRSEKKFLVPQNLVYRYPSIFKLSKYLFESLFDLNRFVSHHQNPLKMKIIEEPCEALVLMIRKYSPL